MTQFYKEFGVGKLGLHKAFRVEHTEDGAEIVPITKIAHVHLDDLVGYEIAEEEADRQYGSFCGRQNEPTTVCCSGTREPENPPRIKAILNQYYDQGLRMIEVYKHQFQDLNDVIAQIKNRNYKFIIYMDDLSFEEFEIEYKYLKAVIEGGLEKKPDNMLIYATSNRRHLIRETFKDKADRDEELHTNDTVQEKLSLVARFGVTIFLEYRQERISGDRTGSCKRMGLICRKMNCFWRRISGSCPAEVCPAGQRSSLLTIFWGQDNMQKDLTHGNVQRTMLVFAGPMIVGNLLQQCYNIADTWVVGQFLGAGALAAVGAAYTLMTFLTSVLIGLCMGSGSVFSFYYGKGDKRKMQESILASFLFIGIISVIVNIAVFAGMDLILKLMRIPEDIYTYMKKYVWVIFWGIFCIFV